MLTPWLSHLGESLRLSELQLPTLGYKTTLTLLCGLRGETRNHHEVKEPSLSASLEGPSKA